MSQPNPAGQPAPTIAYASPVVPAEPGLWPAVRWALIVAAVLVTLRHVLYWGGVVASMGSVGPFGGGSWAQMVGAVPALLEIAGLVLMAIAAVSGPKRPVVGLLLSGAIVGLLTVPLSVMTSTISAMSVGSRGNWGGLTTTLWIGWRLVSSLGFLPIPLLGLLVALRYRRG